jgi:hypothetical protein
VFVITFLLRIAGFCYGTWSLIKAGIVFLANYDEYTMSVIFNAVQKDLIIGGALLAFAVFYREGNKI